MLRFYATLAIALMATVTLQRTVGAEDSVEFLSGTTMNGSVTQIRKNDKEFDFEAKIGSRTMTRTYRFDKVHAVVLNGKRFVLTPKSTSASAETDENENPVRSESEVKEIIDRIGSTPPDWLESTELDYPDTLELDWPIKPPEKGWNNRKNMGQFIWDIINPNPSKWKSGIKLVYHCMNLHQGNRTLTQRDKQVLGRMYFDLLQDYPRAAYWLQLLNPSKGSRQAVMLAECYFRLGNRDMAKRYLTSNSYNVGSAVMAIKLYGNMGELDQALRMTQRIAGTQNAAMGFIAAGDALRQAGRFDEAIEYYTKVVEDGRFRNEDYEQRYKARAQESIDAIRRFENVDIDKIPDGTYTADSTGYNGRLEVAVSVADRRIASVKVTQHKEKQFYSAFTDTEASILKRQTVRGVDGTSGATITSRAIVNATAKALANVTN